MNVNYFFTVAVIYCVREVIHENFFCPELVRPHKQRRSLLYFDTDLLLFGQHVGVLQTAFHETDDIEADHCELRLSELQLIEGQEPCDDPVHLVCFVDDHLCIVDGALRIVRDAFLKSLRISLDQGQRRFQLMRDAGEKLLPHLLGLFLALNVLPELIIGRLELRDRPLQDLRQLIDVLSQLRDLRAALAVILGAEIQVLHS